MNYSIFSLFITLIFWYLTIYHLHLLYQSINKNLFLGQKSVFHIHPISSKDSKPLDIETKDILFSFDVVFHEDIFLSTHLTL